MRVDAAQIKREILQSADKSGIRKRLLSGESGLSTDDVIEIGNAVEKLTEMKGWAYIEAYLYKQADFLGNVIGNKTDAERGKSQAAVELIQYVQQVITAKNEILAEINAKREAGKDAKEAT